MPVAYHPVEKAREQGVSFCETLETTELWMKSMYQNLVLLSKLIFYIINNIMYILLILKRCNKRLSLSEMYVNPKILIKMYTYFQIEDSIPCPPKA